MRYFRIPVFTGIEGHRNKPDRGTMRVVEGCLPYPAGALRSGPVWTELGKLTVAEPTEKHKFWQVTDNLGNKLLIIVHKASNRASNIHMFPATASTPAIGTSVASSTDVTPSNVAESSYATTRVTSSNLGSRWVAVGNASFNADLLGFGGTSVSTTSSDIYDLANTEFPKCTMFVRGPSKTLFGAGDPDNPVSVYVSEPAGLTASTKSALYSGGALSRVDLLLTDATEITALSVLGPYVVVHTDAGVTLLYGSKPDQAETGFRVEQVSSPISSAAINQKVVGGQQNQPYFLARDGQIYKDESTTAGPDGKPLYSDPRQVSWKAKGLWSDESASDISTSFATYDPGIGMYFVHLPTKEAEA